MSLTFASPFLPVAAAFFVSLVRLSSWMILGMVGVAIIFIAGRVRRDEKKNRLWRSRQSWWSVAAVSTATTAVLRTLNF